MAPFFFGSALAEEGVGRRAMGVFARDIGLGAGDFLAQFRDVLAQFGHAPGIQNRSLETGLGRLAALFVIILAHRHPSRWSLDPILPGGHIRANPAPPARRCASVEALGISAIPR